MSLEAATRNRWILGASLVGSAVILLATGWTLRGAGPVAATATPPAQAQQFAGGIQPAAVDSARWDPDPAQGDEPRRLALSVAQGDPDRERALAGPPQQVVPDPAVVAAFAASEAARGEAAAALQGVVDEQKAALAQACLPRGGPDRAMLGMEATFDAGGALVVSEVGHDGTMPEVRDCVAKRLTALKIPGTGAEVTVRAVISLQ